MTAETASKPHRLAFAASGLFITGTDTDVGKTVLSASLIAAIIASGGRVRAHKPVVTGLDHPHPRGWPADHQLLGQLSGVSAEQVSPLRFGPAASPHLAAQLAGVEIDRDRIVDAAAAAAAAAGADEASLIVEGVGGLLVPLAENLTVRDLAAALALPLLIAARPGLGTINHTLLTLQSARAAGLTVRAVVLTPWPQQPGQIMRSNLQTIAAIGEVEVLTLPHVAAPHPDLLAQAGETLPWRRLLSRE